ncbi:MAG TPA: hypothetical protein VN648_03535, partial [Candidatus Methylomirabilis sp.]|nr:hypothetical protein [Candidatus Methylomirabilis sp.]
GKEETVKEAKTPRRGIRLSLVLAFLGVMVVTVPVIYPMPFPASLILIGLGGTVIALALFLLFAL